MKTVEILNVIEEKYHFRMLHLHVLSMMERYYEAYELLQDLFHKFGVNIGLDRLSLKLIP